MMPSLSWMVGGVGTGSGAGPRAFEASAQTIGDCYPAHPNAIIQIVCPGNQFYAPDLYQLESDSVAAYLALHNLPATGAHLIYDVGRTDLRNAVRSTMFASLLAIIQKPPAQRSAHEQKLYNWLQYLVQQNEIADYSAAIGEYNAWQSDPCLFKLDPTIASQFGLSYDGAPFCSPYSQLFSGPPVPAESYFIAYGVVNSYGKPAQSNPDFGKLVASTQLGLGEEFGIGLSASVLVAAGVGAGIAAFATSIFPFCRRSSRSRVLYISSMGDLHRWLGIRGRECCGGASHHCSACLPDRHPCWDSGVQQ
ncbi:MAG: hypothetical protein M3Y72_05545 [Acidobacteriota bacterium]|nr:hypothetical protein [Acidobacteriota bacterium]